jgi:hypothetical protein
MVEFKIENQNATVNESTFSSATKFSVFALKEILKHCENFPQPIGLCAKIFLQVIDVCETNKSIKENSEKYNII